MPIIRSVQHVSLKITCRKGEVILKKADAGFMTADDRDDFREWVRDIADRMRLADYNIVISEQPCERGCLATMEMDFHYREVRIYLCVGFAQLEPVKQRDTIVHELAHGLMKIYQMPYEGLQKVLSSDVWEVTEHNAMAAEENIVTALEWIIGPTMPLPPVWRPSPRKKKK